MAAQTVPIEPSVHSGLRWPTLCAHIEHYEQHVFTWFAGQFLNLLQPTRHLDITGLPRLLADLPHCIVCWLVPELVAAYMTSRFTTSSDLPRSTMHACTYPTLTRAGGGGELP